MKPRPVVIIDLDNCFSDDKWRWEHFELHRETNHERYLKYHELCHRDVPGHTIRHLQRLISMGDLAVFTSRPECVSVQTVQWLLKFDIEVSYMRMRRNDDNRTSVDIKRSMLHEFRKDNPRFRVVHAVDDRIDILQMYLAEGVSSVEKIIIHEEGAPTHDRTEPR